MFCLSQLEYFLFLFPPLIIGTICIRTYLIPKFNYANLSLLFFITFYATCCKSNSMVNTPSCIIINMCCLGCKSILFIAISLYLSLLLEAPSCDMLYMSTSCCSSSYSLLSSYIDTSFFNCCIFMNTLSPCVPSLFSSLGLLSSHSSLILSLFILATSSSS
jgi:hypothetical protein